jgi:hypothetical protein
MLVLATVTQRTTKRCSTANKASANAKAFAHSRSGPAGHFIARG